MAENPSVAEQVDNAELEHRKNELQQKLKKIQNAEEIKGKLPENPLLLLLLKGIPFLPGLIEGIGGTGVAISKLIEVTMGASKAALDAAKGFEITGLIVDAINFVRIPVVYLAAWMLREDRKDKLPFTLTKTAKWLYAAALLGLSLAAFLIPGAAPTIILVSSIITAGVGFITLAKFIYDKMRYRDELSTLSESVKRLETNLECVQEKSKNLESSLAKVKPENIMAFASEVNALDEVNTLYREDLQRCKDRQLICQKKLEKKGTMSTVDKVMGVILPSLMVLSAATSLLFPPVGLAMMATSSILGVGYILARVSIGIAGLVAKRTQNKKAETQALDTASEQPQLHNSDEKMLHDFNIDHIERNEKGQVEDRIRNLLQSCSLSSSDKATQLLHTFLSAIDMLKSKNIKPNLDDFFGFLQEIPEWKAQGPVLMKMIYNEHEEKAEKITTFFREHNGDLDKLKFKQANENAPMPSNKEALKNTMH